MKRVSALLLTCTLGLSALSGCSASAAPQPLSAQPVTISEEEMMRYDLETPPSGPPCLNLGWTC